VLLAPPAGPAAWAPRLTGCRRTGARRGWTLNYIINTHHHSDHTGGNLALKAQTGCTIVGPRADRCVLGQLLRAGGSGGGGCGLGDVAGLLAGGLLRCWLALH
jgi:glyoxylase-like metal-dependent hydrolase (beta-lactamase superfamily II)